MKRTSVAIFALLSAIAPASAADLRDLPSILSMKDTPANTWTGFHLGINGGYGWDANSDVNATSDAVAGQYIKSVTGSLSDSGWFGGVQVGYDTQVSGLVIGAEADIDLANINDDGALKTVTGSTATINGDLHSTIDWIGTLRLRGGVPIGNMLVYATGGFAFGGVSARATSDSLRASVGNDETATGWAAGGGVEYKLSGPWSMKLEYLHYDLGNTGLSATALPTARDIDNQFDAVRLGVNFKTNY